MVIEKVNKKIRGKNMNKNAQVTIFIILAMIIVVLLLLFFLLRKGPEAKIIDENNPQAYVESCVREGVEEALGILLPQGGDIVPKGHVLHKNIETTYLCYTNEYYKHCVNQRPLLPEHIEQEITEYIRPIVKECFDVLTYKLESRYVIESGETVIKTDIYPDQIVVDIEKDFDMIRDEEVRSFKKFRMNMVHPMYNFANIAMEIVNQEAKFCGFDVLGYMIIYPRYNIEKFETGDGDAIYSIRDNPTDEEFKFAIRNCVLPAGY